MKKLFLVTTIMFLAVSCERSGDLTDNTNNNEVQRFSKKTDSTSASDSTTVQPIAPAPVDPKDIVPPRH